MHSIRFPGESAEYRTARFELLQAEIELRKRTEEVAALRRRLPLGGEVPQDYAFTELGPAGSRAVRLSDLFPEGKETLVLYSFMYGPHMERPCPMCTSMLDALDGNVQHLERRIGVAVVAKSPIERIDAFARERGWRHHRLLSSADSTFNRDYHAEDAEGRQLPALNVFVRRDGRTNHFYGAELLYAAEESGQDPRHVDAIWPLWNLLDATPEGRGTDWYPRLEY